MGIALRRAARAAPADPGAARSRRPPPRRAAPDRAPVGGASRSSSGPLLLAALVLALAGFQLVLPVDRLATVFVVDLSDSVGNAGREDALAFLRETLKVMPDGDVAGIVAFGKDALVERLPADLDARSTGSPRRRSRRRPTSAPRCGSRRRSSPTTPRSGSCCCPTATTRPAAARPRRRWPRRAASRSRPGAIGLGDVDEVLVERLTTPSTARLGETIEAVAEIRSTVAQPATVRLFADGDAGRDAAGRARGRRDHGSRSTSSRPRPASTRFRAVVEAGARHVQPERPGRLEHDRQGRAADARPGRRRDRRGRARRRR